MEMQDLGKITGEAVGALCGFVIGATLLPAAAFGITASAGIAAASFVVGAAGGTYGGIQVGKKMEQKTKEENIEET